MGYLFEAGTDSIKVSNLILWTDNTAPLLKQKMALFASFHPSGVKELDIEKLATLFRPFLSKVIANYQSQMPPADDDEIAWTHLTEAEKADFCRIQARELFSFDVQEALKQQDRGRVSDFSLLNERNKKNKKDGTLLLSPVVLLIIEAATIDGNTVRLNAGQLDKRTYQQVNEALTEIGGKWNKKAGGHVFKEDPRDRVESLIATGSVSLKNNFDFFPTPPDMARSLVRKSGLQPGMKVLEPQAGSGVIALAAAEIVGKENVTCIEIDPGRQQELRDAGFAVIPADFLSVTPSIGTFDVVLMNPPFSGRQDIKHVCHAAQFLKDSGSSIAAIMSGGVEFRSDRLFEEFRSVLSDFEGELEVNAEGSFKESGTMVRTVTVTLAGSDEMKRRLNTIFSPEPVEAELSFSSPGM